MAAGKLAFRFTSQVVRLDQAMPFHILPVPDEIAAAWKKARVRRLTGTVNGHAINRALMNHAGGGSFLIVNRDFMKEAGISLKTPAVLAFQPDPTPDRLDMPEEFRLALDQDDAARARWDTVTPGRQRSLLVYITGAKTEPTRIKRALDLAQKIRTHSLYGDLQKKSRPKL
jgi:Bacteriocin-protection, YdeI or OmpD-Associated/Domain of unknown function (DUF1905)